MGLGSGSTAEAVVEALGRRIAAEGLHFTGVATSNRTSDLARSLGITLRTLDEIDRIDLGIDGADEIAPNLDVVKGRGGALLYEKIVAMSCDRYLIVAASEKEVDQLGTRLPLPVEIVPLGWRQTFCQDRIAWAAATAAQGGERDRSVRHRRRPLDSGLRSLAHHRSANPGNRAQGPGRGG